GELGDVEVGGRDDRAMVVDMAARGQDAAPIELGDVAAQLFVDVPVVFLRPHLPVGTRAAAIDVGALVEDQVLAVHGHVAQPVAHADPVRYGAGLAGHGRADV